MWWVSMGRNLSELRGGWHCAILQYADEGEDDYEKEKLKWSEV